MKLKLFFGFLSTCLALTSFTKTQADQANGNSIIDRSYDNQCVSKKKEDEIVKLVEKYLNEISEFEAEFEQFMSKTGEVSHGKVYIKRPDLIRVEYNAPNPHVVVIDSKNIHHYDRELKEESVLPKKASPFGIFLNREVSLKNFIVTGISVDHEHIYVQVKPKKQSDQKFLKLVFNENPIELHQWQIVSKSGEEVVVSILNFRKKLDKNISLSDLANCKKLVNSKR